MSSRRGLEGGACCQEEGGTEQPHGGACLVVQPAACSNRTRGDGEGRVETARLEREGAAQAMNAASARASARFLFGFLVSYAASCQPLLLFRLPSPKPERPGTRVDPFSSFNRSEPLEFSPHDRRPKPDSRAIKDGSLNVATTLQRY